MAKVKVAFREDGGRVLLYLCPGCECTHGADIDQPNPLTGAKWTWNGDVDKPTVSPSVNYPNRPRCHFHIREGRIEYCGDCDHPLAGQTVDLPDVTEDDP